MCRLLVVEDEPNTLSGLQELLRQEGYRVRGVTHGRQALETVLNEPIDIVICDYSLPDLDGLQVCRELKRLQPALELFLVTAYSNTEIGQAVKACNITEIFHKPLDVEELLEKLAAFASRGDRGEKIFALA